MVLEFLVKMMEPLVGIKPEIIPVFLIAVFLAIIITIINKFAVNRKLMKEIKIKMTEIKENLSKAQKDGDKENANKYMNEYMKMNTQMMKQTFKSLLISMVFIMLFLPVLNHKYGADKENEIDPVVVAKLPFSFPIIGKNGGWLIWYFIVSIAVSITLKKIIGE